MTQMPTSLPSPHDPLTPNSGSPSVACMSTHVTYSAGNADLNLGGRHIVHLVGVTSLVARDLTIV